jgi:hypothetical protein
LIYQDEAGELDQLWATGLGFRYLGFADQGGGPSSVYIVVQGGRTGVVFSNIVQLGEIFFSEGDWKPPSTADIEVYTDNVGEPGTLLYSTSIDTSCSTPVLTLTAVFGPLQLTAFEYYKGYFSSVYPVRLQYFVRNLNGVAMVVESAYISSPFQDGPFNALGNGTQTISGVSNLLVYEESTTIDFGAKFSQGITYDFAMNTTGRAVQSGIGCSAQFASSF